MKVQIIEQNGFPEYAVIPYEELKTLLARMEELEDICDARSASMAVAAGEETFPAEFVDRLCADEHPLRLWREYRGFTLAALGKVCDVSASALSQVEKGKRSPSVELLGKLARALECDMEDLVPAVEPQKQ
mgnify:CR=1 FL=1